MSLLFKDGFDYLTAANNNVKWDNASSSGTITGAYGKGKGLVSANQTKTLGSNITEGYVGFHFFYAAAGAGTICRFQDAGAIQTDFRTDGAGAIRATNNGTTIGTTSTFHLVANTLYWIQARVKISDTVGIAELSVNGTIVVNSGVTNLDTKNTANAFFNQVGIGTAVTGSWFDSFHAWDTAGGDSFSGYIAETLIDTSLMTAAGSNTTWTPNASTNVSRINEANFDTTTYNSSSTANQIDSFVPATLLEASGVILDRAINTIDEIDDATPRVINHYMKSGGSSALSGAISPSGGYMNHQSFFPVDPATGVAWTIAGANSSEPGYKLIS